MKQSLYEIATEAQRVAQRLIESGGEMTPELELSIALNDLDMESKIDAYAEVMARFENEEMYWKQREQECAKMKMVYQNSHKRMKNVLKETMVRLDRKKLDGDFHGFTLSQSAGSLVIEDETMIPGIYKIQTVTVEISKAMLKEALQSGEQIAGAHIEPSFTLRQRTSKTQLGETNGR